LILPKHLISRRISQFLDLFQNTNGVLPGGSVTTTVKHTNTQRAQNNTTKQKKKKKTKKNKEKISQLTKLHKQ
jgi:hypothetical protein